MSSADFALAAAGAAAALAGLLVVAVSINIREIVATRSLTRRAGVALVSLTAPLVMALVVLIPSDSPGVLGSLVLVTGIVTALALGPLVLPPQLSSQRTMAQWALGGLAQAWVLLIEILR